MVNVIETFDAKETFALGEKIGKEVQPGDIFCLEGDLGVGKTVYKEGRIPLYHFDLYRIADISELDEIGYEEYFYSEGTCLVEWGNLYPEIFPENTIKIEISKDLSKGFDYRRVTIEKQQKED